MNKEEKKMSESQKQAKVERPTNGANQHITSSKTKMMKATQKTTAIVADTKRTQSNSGDRLSSVNVSKGTNTNCVGSPMNIKCTTNATIASNKEMRQQNRVPLSVSEKICEGATSSSNCDKKSAQESVSSFFPHIAVTQRHIREIIVGIGRGTLQQRMMVVIKQYIVGCREAYENSSSCTMKCRRLTRNISRTMDLIHSICSTFTDSYEYLYRMSELVAIYVSSELSYAKDFTEHKPLIANRISNIIYKHLIVPNEDQTKANLLRMFVCIPEMYKEREVMTKIFKEFIWKKGKELMPQQELPDKLYIQYLIVFYQWKQLETDVVEQLRVIEFANNFMRPSSTLCSNATYARYLPKYDNLRTATKFCLQHLKFLQTLRNSSIYDNCLKSAINIVDLSDDEEPIEYSNSSYPSFGEIAVNVSIDPVQKSTKLEEQLIVATVDLTLEDENTSFDSDVSWLRELRSVALRLAPTARPLLASRSTTHLSGNSQSNEIIDLATDSDPDEQNAVVATGSKNVNTGIVTIDFDEPECIEEPERIDAVANTFDDDLLINTFDESDEDVAMCNANPIQNPPNAVSTTIASDETNIENRSKIDCTMKSSSKTTAMRIINAQVVAQTSNKSSKQAVNIKTVTSATIAHSKISNNSKVSKSAKISELKTAKVINAEHAERISKSLQPQEAMTATSTTIERTPNQAHPHIDHSLAKERNAPIKENNTKSIHDDDIVNISATMDIAPICKEDNGEKSNEITVSVSVEFDAASSVIAETDSTTVVSAPVEQVIAADKSAVVSTSLANTSSTAIASVPKSMDSAAPLPKKSSTPIVGVDKRASHKKVTMSFPMVSMDNSCSYRRKSIHLTEDENLCSDDEFGIESELPQRNSRLAATNAEDEDDLNLFTTEEETIVNDESVGHTGREKIIFSTAALGQHLPDPCVENEPLSDSELEAIRKLKEAEESVPIVRALPSLQRQFQKKDLTSELDDNTESNNQHNNRNIMSTSSNLHCMSTITSSTTLSSVGETDENGIVKRGMSDVSPTNTNIIKLNDEESMREDVHTIPATVSTQPTIKRLSLSNTNLRKATLQVNSNNSNVTVGNVPNVNRVSDAVNTVDISSTNCNDMSVIGRNETNSMITQNLVISDNACSSTVNPLSSIEKVKCTSSIHVLETSSSSENRSEGSTNTRAFLSSAQEPVTSVSDDADKYEEVKRFSLMTIARYAKYKTTRLSKNDIGIGKERWQGWQMGSTFENVSIVSSTNDELGKNTPIQEKEFEESLDIEQDINSTIEENQNKAIDSNKVEQKKIEEIEGSINSSIEEIDKNTLKKENGDILKVDLKEIERMSPIALVVEKKIENLSTNKNQVEDFDNSSTEENEKHERDNQKLNSCIETENGYAPSGDESISKNQIISNELSTGGINSAKESSKQVQEDSAIANQNDEVASVDNGDNKAACNGIEKESYNLLNAENTGDESRKNVLSKKSPLEDKDSCARLEQELDLSFEEVNIEFISDSTQIKQEADVEVQGKNRSTILPIKDKNTFAEDQQSGSNNLLEQEVKESNAASPVDKEVQNELSNVEGVNSFSDKIENTKDQNEKVTIANIPENIEQVEKDNKTIEEINSEDSTKIKHSDESSIDGIHESIFETQKVEIVPFENALGNHVGYKKNFQDTFISEMIEIERHKRSITENEHDTIVEDMNDKQVAFEKQEERTTNEQNLNSSLEENKASELIECNNVQVKISEKENENKNLLVNEKELAMDKIKKYPEISVLNVSADATEENIMTKQRGCALSKAREDVNSLSEKLKVHLEQNDSSRSKDFDDNINFFKYKPKGTADNVNALSETESESETNSSHLLYNKFNSSSSSVFENTDIIQDSKKLPDETNAFSDISEVHKQNVMSPIIQQTNLIEEKSEESECFWKIADNSVLKYINNTESSTGDGEKPLRIRFIKNGKQPLGATETKSINTGHLYSLLVQSTVGGDENEIQDSITSESLTSDLYTSNRFSPTNKKTTTTHCTDVLLNDESASFNNNVNNDNDNDNHYYIENAVFNINSLCSSIANNEVNNETSETQTIPFKELDTEKLMINFNLTSKNVAENALDVEKSKDSSLTMSSDGSALSSTCLHLFTADNANCNEVINAHNDESELPTETSAAKQIKDFVENENLPLEYDLNDLNLIVESELPEPIPKETDCNVISIVNDAIKNNNSTNNTNVTITKKRNSNDSNAFNRELKRSCKRNEKPNEPEYELVPLKKRKKLCNRDNNTSGSKSIMPFSYDAMIEKSSSNYATIEDNDEDLRQLTNMDLGVITLLKEPQLNDTTFSYPSTPMVGVAHVTDTVNKSIENLLTSPIVQKLIKEAEKLQLELNKEIQEWVGNVILSAVANCNFNFNDVNFLSKDYKRQLNTIINSLGKCLQYESRAHPNFNIIADIRSILIPLLKNTNLPVKPNSIADIFVIDLNSNIEEERHFAPIVINQNSKINNNNNANANANVKGATFSNEQLLPCHPPLPYNMSNFTNNIKNAISSCNTLISDKAGAAAAAAAAAESLNQKPKLSFFKTPNEIILNTPVPVLQPIPSLLTTANNPSQLGTELFTSRIAHTYGQSTKSTNSALSSHNFQNSNYLVGSSTLNPFVASRTTSDNISPGHIGPFKNMLPTSMPPLSPFTISPSPQNKSSHAHHEAPQNMHFDIQNVQFLTNQEQLHQLCETTQTLQQEQHALKSQKRKLDIQNVQILKTAHRIQQQTEQNRHAPYALQPRPIDIENIHILQGPDQVTIEQQSRTRESEYNSQQQMPTQHLNDFIVLDDQLVDVAQREKPNAHEVAQHNQMHLQSEQINEIIIVNSSGPESLQKEQLQSPQLLQQFQSQKLQDMFIFDDQSVQVLQRQKHQESQAQAQAQAQIQLQSQFQLQQLNDILIFDGQTTQMLQLQLQMQQKKTQIQQQKQQQEQQQQQHIYIKQQQQQPLQQQPLDAQQKVRGRRGRKPKAQTDGVASNTRSKKSVDTTVTVTTTATATATVTAPPPILSIPPYMPAPAAASKRTRTRQIKPKMPNFTTNTHSIGHCDQKCSNCMTCSH